MKITGKHILVKAVQAYLLCMSALFFKGLEKTYMLEYIPEIMYPIALSAAIFLIGSMIYFLYQILFKW